MHYVGGYVNLSFDLSPRATVTGNRNLVEGARVRPHLTRNGQGDGHCFLARCERAFGRLGTQRLSPVVPGSSGRDRAHAAHRGLRRQYPHFGARGGWEAIVGSGESGRRAQPWPWTPGEGRAFRLASTGR